MSDDQAAQLERRAAQRFDFHLPVGIQIADSESEGFGFTQNLSARGAFLYTELALAEGNAVKLTLVMPSEITLAENMRVRCQGRVMRIIPMANKSAVAVYLEGYEFLPQGDVAAEASASFARISALHEHVHEDETPVGRESRGAAAR
jgi:hypothetical protein